MPFYRCIWKALPAAPNDAKVPPLVTHFLMQSVPLIAAAAVPAVSKTNGTRNDVLLANSLYAFLCIGLLGLSQAADPAHRGSVCRTHSNHGP